MLQKKIEERFKEQVKLRKELQKEKRVMEEFIKSVIPQSKLAVCLDGEKKFSDVEVLKKVWNDVHSQNSNNHGS